MIKPTVGRVLWYRPNLQEQPVKDGQPFAAIVTKVHNDTLVNLTIMNDMGHSYAKQNVVLAQDRAAQMNECEWMPYQIGQAYTNARPHSVPGQEKVN